MKWIPVTEQEPDFFQPVLVVTRDKRYSEESMLGAWKIDVDKIVLAVGWKPFHVVSHWMPLPDMPEQAIQQITAPDPVQRS